MNELVDRPIEIARSLDDPRIKVVKNAIETLRFASRNPEIFENGPWVFVFSTGSLNKQLAAAEAINNKLGPVPILFSEEPLPFHRQPELDPFTGEVKTEDQMAARNITAFFPCGEEFTCLPLSRQVQINAFLKAIFDWNIDPVHSPFVCATDVMGKAGDYPLIKEKTPGRQRTALEKIAGAGMIEGAVGVAVGHIKDPRSEIPGDFRLSERGNFLSRSLRARVHVDAGMAKAIDEYIRQGQEEIQQSGWVLNVLGPVCQRMGLVKRIEIEVAGQFREVTLGAAKDVIAGYPVDFLTTLLKEKYPNGNYDIIDQREQLRSELWHARQRLILSLKNLTGLSIDETLDLIEDG